MDIILLIIGIILVVIGANKKVPDGSRSGGGLIMIIIGAVFLGIGSISFIFGFMIGFSSAF